MTKRRLKKISAWLAYTIGLTGYGPIMMDKKPPRALGPRERIVFRRMHAFMLAEQQRRRDAFDQALFEVTGEHADGYGPPDYPMPEGALTEA